MASLPTKDKYIQSITPMIDQFECSICGDPFSAGHTPAKLAECGHIFGTQCIVKWFETDNEQAHTCPMCRRELFEPEVFEEEEESEEEVRHWIDALLRQAMVLEGRFREAPGARHTDTRRASLTPSRESEGLVGPSRRSSHDNFSRGLEESDELDWGELHAHAPQLTRELGDSLQPDSYYDEVYSQLLESEEEYETEDGFDALDQGITPPSQEQYADEQDAQDDNSREGEDEEMTDVAGVEGDSDPESSKSDAMEIDECSGSDDDESRNYAPEGADRSGWAFDQTSRMHSNIDRSRKVGPGNASGQIGHTPGLWFSK